MNDKVLMRDKRWHGQLDTELGYASGRFTETKETKYFVIQERELSYRFHLHQHPYVQQLLQRLIRKGTAGLQAADTEYNTRVRLTVATSAERLDGRPVQLAADEVLHIPDGATATLDGSAIRLAGSKVLTLLDDLPVVPAANTVVTVPGKTKGRRREGDIVTLNADAVVALVDGVPLPVLHSDFFSRAYQPNPDLVPDSEESPHPVKDLDFSAGGAYSIYNWELFYHVPITIAIHLSKNQRFAEAQRWFHFLFDPTDDSDGVTPERFWKVQPFQNTDIRKIEDILVNLATGADVGLRNETIRSMTAWKDAPFRPHVIARYRQQAYMYKTVMAYLDNLIAWGDSLFRQDTGEAIDEAMMVYVLAANILGPRPQPVPKKGAVRQQTYANLRKDLSQFGTVMRDIEADVPFDLAPFPNDSEGDNDRLATLRSLGKALYFCVPRNDKLLSYWDTVADRLFKIRNSLNFQGAFRQLALFEPPIDPAMLARAAASGLDVGAIVNGLNQPLPLVRFQLLVQKAAEIAQEVKSLGNQLLSTMEKEDGEALAVLRAKHEGVVMEMVEHVRYGQVQEAIKSKEGLLQSLAQVVQRYSYYERQLGKKADEIEQAIPELGELDKDSLEEMKFAMKEPEMVPREIEVDIAQDLGDSGGHIVSSHEVKELKASYSARKWQNRASDTASLASLSYYIPSYGTDLAYWGVGMHLELGGQHVGPAIQAITEYERSLSALDSYDSAHAGKVGGYQQREQDWAFQSNLVAGEITQVFKQIRAAEIRQAIAELELKNHRQQMKHAEEIERFLNEEGTERAGKKTNKALYAWMKREVKGLYSQSFQFAFDIAKKAERALQHELGNPELSYLQFGYLAGKEGLLAGERLYLDVKRMEMAYQDLNQREFELTRHVSLLQVEPLALIKLRTTGRCTVRLPEALFDMDGPGHYFRRIKTVAVSMPCVTGPYASVNCTLSLVKSSIRKTQTLQDKDYAREDAEDDRFDDYFGSLQSIVTSSAQNDSGLFETNLRDERYLPFENSGVISEWQLELPANPGNKDPSQFDYKTISDVVLHLRYTARAGGDLLKNEAKDHVNALVKEARAVGSVRLFSVRHEFPTEWANFQSQTPAPNGRFELSLDLRPEHYPFWSQGRLNSVARVDVFAHSAEDAIPGSMEIFETADKNEPATRGTLTKDAALGNLLSGSLTSGLPARPDGEMKFFTEANTISDLWIAVTWSEAV